MPPWAHSKCAKVCLFVLHSSDWVGALPNFRSNITQGVECPWGAQAEPLPASLGVLLLSSLPGNTWVAPAWDRVARDLEAILGQTSASLGPRLR